MNFISEIKNIFKGKKPVIDSGKRLEGNNKAYCVCCNKEFRAFLPFGVVKRANALCPSCGSLERHRLHWHYFQNRTNLFAENSNKLKLLHVAPEAIFYKKFINDDKIDYIPCDKFEEGYEHSYPPKTKNIDITDISFGNNEFDVIYCSHVLEHIPDDIKAMKELQRVLKPGGWAMLQVPLDKNRMKTYEDFSIVDPKEREKAFGQYDHVRVYGLDYIERLRLAGFTVNQINYTSEFSENELFYNGFQKGEDIFICTKQ